LNNRLFTANLAVLVSGVFKKTNQNVYTNVSETIILSQDIITFYIIQDTN
jgi:hypothetical protein